MNDVTQILERAEKGVRMFMKPAVLSIMGFVSSIFWGLLISLIAAAVLKRKATEEVVVTTV